MNLFRKKLNSRGQAVVEFASVIPVMVSIIFGVIELSNVLVYSLRASNLSREIANAAFRDCAYLSSASLTNCLQTSANRVRDEANLIDRKSTRLNSSH